MPLWTATTVMSSLQCGWAFSSEGTPWVAQRVCPMPQVPDSALPELIRPARAFSRPFALTTFTSSPSRTASPAES